MNLIFEVNTTPELPMSIDNITNSPIALIKRALTAALLSAAATACEQRIANAEQPSSVREEPASMETGIATLSSKDDPAPAGENVGEATNDGELRRGYGVVDMRFNACVAQTNDYTLRGKSCPPGFVIYGPYVSVPANSEIEISFDVKPSKAFEIYADVVSKMGATRLAGLDRQTVDGGSTKKLGYRVHLFDADVNVESRIGMNAEPGTEFEISNLVMTVR